MPYPTEAQIRSILGLLLQPPSGSEHFFTHVREDVTWIVTGKSFLSGVWTSKASYRAATWEKIGQLIKPPGIKLALAQGGEGIIVGNDGWVSVDLHTVDTYTIDGIPYDQSYAWHLRFDEDGMIAQVKVWLDTLTLERVLGSEAAEHEVTIAQGNESGT